MPEYAKVDDEALTAEESPIKDVEAVEPNRFDWPKIVSMFFMVAMVVAIALELNVEGLQKAVEIVPSNPVFWLVFLAYYFILPVCDWTIFRRIWNIPYSGISILIRKRVVNEVLLNYSGELYFYMWAKERVQLTSAPFAVIKDVAITSALSNNFITMAMLIAVWPYIGAIDPAFQSTPAFISAGVIVAISTAIIFFRGMIFSQGRADLIFMVIVHIIRIIISTFLLAWLWSLVLPDIPLLWWFALAAAKLLISRLPFVPNVELMFVTVSVFLVGGDAELGALMAMIAGLTFITHICVVAILPILQFILTRKA